MIRWPVRALLGLIVLIGLYLLGALAGGLIPGKVEAHPQGQDVRIHLVRGPIHYDFVLPATAQTVETFGVMIDGAAPLRGADWVIVGWGAKNFYTTTGSYRDLTLHTIWTALTGDDAVLRIDGWGHDPYVTQLPALDLSQAQYDALLASIASTAVTQAAPVDAPGFNDRDVFVAATGRFHLFRTCNAWIGAQLRAAGVAMGIWTPTPYAVTLSLMQL